MKRYVYSASEYTCSSNKLEDFNENSRGSSGTRVRIRKTGQTGRVESVVRDKWSTGLRVILDDRPGMYPEFFDVEEVDILD